MFAGRRTVESYSHRKSQQSSPQNFHKNCAYIYIYTHVYIYMYIYIYIYMYITWLAKFPSVAVVDPVQLDGGVAVLERQ